MKDITLQVFDIKTLVAEGEEVATVAMMTGLPVPGPNGQAMILPSETYRVLFNKPSLGEFIKSLQEAHDELPDPKPQSNIVVPGSMSDAERFANDLKRFQ